MHVFLVLILAAFLLNTENGASADEIGPTKEDVAFVQGLLKRFGYDPGPIDGICGDLTMAAVRAFHDERDLPLAPGDIAHQATTVAKNLMVAVVDHVMRPDMKVGKTYLDALSCDAEAAFKIGKTYQRGDVVAVDHMLAYTWLLVAQKNATATAVDKRNPANNDDVVEYQAALKIALDAARAKDEIEMTASISKHEKAFAIIMAQRICAPPLQDSRIARLNVTM